MFKVIFGYTELTFSLSFMRIYFKKNQRQGGFVVRTSDAACIGSHGSIQIPLPCGLLPTQFL